MGYNVNLLPDFINQDSKEFVVRSILDGQTVAMLVANGTFDAKLKGKTAIQLMDKDTVFQKDEGCGTRSPQGGVALSQAYLEPSAIKIEENYCNKDLITKWTVGELQNGVIYDDLALAKDLSEEQSKNIEEGIEELIWQGDTDEVGNLQHFDGYIKQIEDATDAIDLSAVTGADAIDKLRKAYKLIPVKVTRQADFRLFIGQDTANEIMALLADKDFYHQENPEFLRGTLAKFAIVNGLNYTGKAVFTRLRSLYAGGELEESVMEALYSVETKSIYFDSAFSLGASIVYPEEMGILDLN